MEERTVYSMATAQRGGELLPGSSFRTPDVVTGGQPCAQVGPVALPSKMGSQRRQGSLVVPGELG